MAQPPPVGGLSQLPGASGCFSFDGSAGACGTARALDGAESAALSPDGQNLYVGSYQAGGSEPGVSIFSRDPGTGALTQLGGTAGCLTADGNSQAGASSCTSVKGLTGVGDGRDLAFTSDGKSAYMVAQGGGIGARPTIMLFSRSPDNGALRQFDGTGGCISDNGSSQAGVGTCQMDSTLIHPVAVTISPDNHFVYITDRGAPSGIKVYSRDPSTGGLTQVQCLEVAPGCGGGTSVTDAGDANSFVISSDGTHAYSADAAANGISIFDRNLTTGLLTEKACVSANGKDNTGANTCAHANALGGAHGLALSPDGQTLYVSSTADSGIAIFNVNADGTLSQPSGTDGCVTLDGKSGGVAGKCGVGRGLVMPYLPAASPNGKNLYVPSKASSAGGVAIFAIDHATGKLNQLPGDAGCITADGSSGGVAGQCTGGTAVAGGSSMAIDPGSGFAYLAAYNARAVAAFAIQGIPSCAPATVSTAYLKPVTISLQCTDADGDTITRSITSAPGSGTLGPVDEANGTVTYTPSTLFTRADSFSFTGSDGTNTSGQTIVTVRAADPTLSRVRQSKQSWRRREGTTFKFRLNEAAIVTLTFELPHSGRRVKGVCQPATTRNASHPKCTLMRAVGKLRVNGVAGGNRIRFKGRLKNGRRLKPGSYKVWLVADNGGGSSRAKQLQFVILS